MSMAPGGPDGVVDVASGPPQSAGADSMLAGYEADRDEFLLDPESGVAGWFAAFPPNELDWITRPPAGPAVVADYVEALRQGARGWLRETEVRMMSWSFDPASIAVPVRAFHGEIDAWELLENTRRTIESIPAGSLTVYPGGSHLAPLMHCDDLLAAAVGEGA